MKELYLETKDGNIQIDHKQIEKYNIEEGKISPFTKLRIVDKNGNFPKTSRQNETSSPKVEEMPEGEGLEDDEIIEFPGGEIYSQSEIIDISQGTDSLVVGNKEQ